MKKKTKLFSILSLTLFVAGVTYTKVASAACFIFYDFGGGASAICW